jgi:hypothetical protein
MRTVDLGHGVQFAVDNDIVCTRFYERGKLIGEAYATREPTEENVKQARSQGYNCASDKEACFASLVDHEVLHTIVWRLLFSDYSGVLMHEAGIRECPYLTRLWEETIVLSAQQIYKTMAANELARVWSELKVAA